MPVHINSLEAIRQLKNGEMMSPMRWAAYDAVQRLGPVTANELHKAAGHDQRNNMGSRLLDLELMGLVKRGDSRPCRVTGKSCLTWSAVQVLPAVLGLPRTSSLYKKTETLPQRCQRLEAELQAMTEKCRRLARLQGVDDL